MLRSFLPNPSSHWTLIFESRHLPLASSQHQNPLDRFRNSRGYF